MPDAAPDTADPQPTIRVRDLRKTFNVPVREGGLSAAARSLVRRETREIAAVAGISFEIAPGEVVGFLGPNGAGKTTSLKMLSGLLYPTARRGDGPRPRPVAARVARSSAGSRWSWATATSSSGTCPPSTRSS